LGPGTTTGLAGFSASRGVGRKSSKTMFGVTVLESVRPIKTFPFFSRTLLPGGTGRLWGGPAKRSLSSLIFVLRGTSSLKDQFSKSSLVVVTRTCIASDAPSSVAMPPWLLAATCSRLPAANA